MRSADGDEPWKLAYEARGNVRRIFPIAWQFRREQAIF
jgi:hypothetical protein